MLEPMRKPRTDTVELRFIGPAAARDEAARLLKDLGFVSADDSIPWREAMPFDSDQLPGVCLAGARHREGLSQRKLADLTGIAQRHISEMETGKRTIGKERAKVLAKALNTDYRVFL